MTSRWEVERAVLASGLPAPARLLMLTLATRTTKGGVEIPAEFSPSHNRLAEWTGLSRNAVIKHLKSLEAEGWLCVGRAAPAQQRSQKTPNRYTLRIPASASRALADPVTSARGGLELVHQVDSVSAPGAPNQNSFRTSQNSLGSHSTNNPLAQLDATDDERQSLVDYIQREHKPRNLAAYLNTLASNGDLADHLDAIRKEHGKRAISEELTQARTGPECTHGIAGGQHRRSDTGRLLCPQCQLAAPKEAS